MPGLICTMAKGSQMTSKCVHLGRLMFIVIRGLQFILNLLCLDAYWFQANYLIQFSKQLKISNTLYFPVGNYRLKILVNLLKCQ